MSSINSMATERGRDREIERERSVHFISFDFDGIMVQLLAHRGRTVIITCVAFVFNRHECLHTKSGFAEN